MNDALGVRKVYRGSRIGLSFGELLQERPVQHELEIVLRASLTPEAQNAWEPAETPQS